MPRESKLLAYLGMILTQIMRSPGSLPGIISRIRTFMAVARKGDRHRRAMQERLGMPLPFFCIFSVTWRCNLTCEGCYALNYTRKKDMSLDEICGILEECRNLGTFFFIIAGGEPLMVDGLLERIAGFRDAFFLFYTNGTLVEQHVECFRKARNVLPVISIEGDEVHTDSRRGRGVGDSVARAMELLRKNRVPFGFSTMITHGNVREVTSREWLEVLWKRGARYGIFTDYIPFPKNLNPSFILTDDDRAYKDEALGRRKR